MRSDQTSKCIFCGRWFNSHLDDLFFQISYCFQNVFYGQYQSLRQPKSDLKCTKSSDSLFHLIRWAIYNNGENRLHCFEFSIWVYCAVSKQAETNIEIAGGLVIISGNSNPVIKKINVKVSSSNFEPLSSYNMVIEILKLLNLNKLLI